MQAPHRGGAGLTDSGTADAHGADHAGEPRQAVEARRLWNRQAEHAEIEKFGIEPAPPHFRLGDVGGELDGVKVGEAALPLGERSTPVRTIRDPRGHGRTPPGLEIAASSKIVVMVLPPDCARC